MIANNPITYIFDENDANKQIALTMMRHKKKSYSRVGQQLTVWTGQSLEYYMEYESNNTAISRHVAITLEECRCDSILCRLRISLSPDHVSHCPSPRSCVVGYTKTHTRAMDITISVDCTHGEKYTPQCQCERLFSHWASEAHTYDDYVRAYYVAEKNILMKTYTPFAKFAIAYLNCTARTKLHDEDSDDRYESPTMHPGYDDEVTGYIHYDTTELCECCNATFTTRRVCVYCSCYMRRRICTLHLVSRIISHTDISSMVRMILMLL